MPWSFVCFAASRNGPGSAVDTALSRYIALGCPPTSEGGGENTGGNGSVGSNGGFVCEAEP